MARMVAQSARNFGAPLAAFRPESLGFGDPGIAVAAGSRLMDLPDLRVDDFPLRRPFQPVSDRPAKPFGMR
jgi:hypothetical protein